MNEPPAGPNFAQPAHAALLEELRALEEASHAGAVSNGPELGRRLSAARASIASHFRGEEQNGWLEQVGQEEPRLEPTLQLLRAEHRQLLQSLDTLIEEAQASGASLGALGEKVFRWAHRVRAHEARENEILEDALVQDLGQGD